MSTGRLGWLKSAGFCFIPALFFSVLLSGAQGQEGQSQQTKQPPAASAHDPATPTPQGVVFSIAFVDMKRLSEEYKALNEDNQRFMQEQQWRQDIVDAIPFLKPDESKELIELADKTNRDEKEERRLRSLVKTGLSRREDLLNLQRRVSKSGEEKKRQEELEKSMRENAQRSEDLREKYEEILEAMERDLSKRHYERIRESVEAIAKEKNLKLVLTRDAHVVLFADQSLDITTEVLAKLNATEKPAKK